MCMRACVFGCTCVHMHVKDLLKFMLQLLLACFLGQTLSVAWGLLIQAA